MNYISWIALFAATLVELRPHLSARMANSVGEQEYTADNSNPKGTARAYHVKHGGTLPAAKH
jgi:hypothetical protein